MAQCDDSEDSDSPNYDTCSNIQLGFLEETSPDGLRCSDFPSKVGGRPLWLIPIDLPSESQLKCKTCHASLRFLLQVYAPLDEFSRSYHRYLLVFCCGNGSCLKSEGSIKVFRSQLPANNDFFDPPCSSPRSSSFCSPRSRSSPLCAICGLPGWKKCAGCNSVFYCNKSCQVNDWKACGHSKICTNKSFNKQIEACRLSFLYPESEIVTEEEVFDERLQDFSQEKELLAQYQKNMQDSTEEADDDDDVEPYKTADTKFLAFQRRISHNPSQCIRYYLGKNRKPLWVSSEDTPDTIPKCNHCGGTRRFEFQILPQLIYYLKLDCDTSNGIDWGTLAIYTCVNSCETTSAYSEEFIWRQPAPP